MIRHALAAALSVLSAGVAATQSLTFVWDDPLVSLKTFVVECKKTGPGSGDARTIAGTAVEATTATVSLADGPQFCWLKSCWTTDTTCTSSVGGGSALAGPVGTGAQATASAGANGLISPDSRAVVAGNTTTFTVTPGGGYTANMGGTCPAGSLVGTTYTTGVLTQPTCTVIANFYSGSPGPDIVSPTVSGFSINDAGTTLTGTFSEAVTLNNAIPTLQSSRGTPTLSAPQSGSGSTRTWTIAPTIRPGDVVYVSYTQPGNGIEDAAGNDLASFQSVLATNNSTAAALSSVSVTPTNRHVFPRATTSVSLSATTDQAAECGYGPSSSTVWDDLEGLATSDDLTHTATIQVRAGVSYRTCVRCRDADTGEEIPAVCSLWGVYPWGWR